MDGLGIAPAGAGNAVTLAKTPNLERLKATYANAELSASGLDVGLPDGQMGNSEVGHLNIGAGRVVYQDITAIDKSIADGEFFKNHTLVSAIESGKGDGIHLMGLLSNGGIHSHINHLFALLKLCKSLGAKKVYIHVITDGRDTAPKSAREYLAQLEQKIAEYGIGKISTIGGRYYTMDRDNRTDRTQAAYDCISIAKGGHTKNVSAFIDQQYEGGITDEFFVPTSIGDYKGIGNGETVIFYNFRSDRAKQITAKIINERRVRFVAFTLYDKSLHVDIAFPKQGIKNTLGEVLSLHNLTQIRIAETEKFAHVTSFFNGGIQDAYKGEQRILIPSPKVATYDLEPKMSALEITTRALQAVGEYDVLIMNYANCDMVGHTGKIDKAVIAVETVDDCVGKVVNAVLKSGGTAIITADHGNAEEMLAPDGTVQPAHTTNPVPIILAGKGFEVGGAKVLSGRLCDIAPTFLKILDIEKPKDMGGKFLY
jgi:2,3-bisphosphoglycerate-independent phosphoglycerate mutase